MEVHVFRPHPPARPAHHAAVNPGPRHLPGPGPVLPGTGRPRRLPARAADHSVYPALSLGRRTQFTAPAALAGTPHRLRPHDPRLAPWWRREPQGQVDVHRLHVSVGSLAAVE